MKLNGKAIKFSNRALKSKALRSLRISSCPPCCKDSLYFHHLLARTFGGFKRFLLRARVKGILNQKARELMRAQYYRNYFPLLRGVVEEQRATLRQERMKYKQALMHQNLLTKQRCLRAIKTHCYRRRVFGYLRQKYVVHKLVSGYFNMFRDLYFARITERLKVESLGRRRELYLLGQSLQALKDHRQARFIKSVFRQRADSFRGERLLSISLQVLCFYKQHRHSKSEEYTATVRAREGAIVNQALLKVVKVGMYWAAIKGRFRSGPSKESA